MLKSWVRSPSAPPGFVRNCVSNFARASQAPEHAVSNEACPGRAEGEAGQIQNAPADRELRPGKHSPYQAQRLPPSRAAFLVSGSAPGDLTQGCSRASRAASRRDDRVAPRQPTTLPFRPRPLIAPSRGVVSRPSRAVSRRSQPVSESRLRCRHPSTRGDTLSWMSDIGWWMSDLRPDLPLRFRKRG